LKPGNILFESDPHGRVALADFGIARIVGAAQIPITGAVSMAGTPTYISPEALRSQPVSFATDIYSCGVILYETIAGKPPFSAILAGIERDLLVLQ
jgi:serine/threonine-protein kinase